MKKNYETPNVEVVKFQYKDQIVAQSGVCWITVSNEVKDISGRCRTEPVHTRTNN